MTAHLKRLQECQRTVFKQIQMDNKQLLKADKAMVNGKHDASKEFIEKVETFIQMSIHNLLLNRFKRSSLKIHWHVEECASQLSNFIFNYRL